MFATKKLVRNGAFVLAIGAMSCFMSSDVFAQRRGGPNHSGRNYRGGSRNAISIVSFGGSRGLNFSYGRGGPSRGYVAGYGFGTYRAPVFTQPSRGRYDARYVDYHPGRYVYVPAHYHTRRGGHWDY